MARTLSEEQIEALWENLEELQSEFPNTIKGFLYFAQVVISSLIPGSPDLNRVQADICAYLFGGPTYRMIQAQRGQAKTTLTAIFGVFMLIHNPHWRITIVSQKGKRAKEIAGWVIKIFKGLDFLNFMLPDKQGGDRESIEAFDIHWALKGEDKSPSVACESIEAGIQGARADIIIADDIESLQNSRTVAGREILEDASREFESVCTHGDIIYLGTPQSQESIYNNLPSRGYDIRIWPGRYPTVKEVPNYGNYLAPLIQADIEKDCTLQFGGGLCGDRGKPTCPEMFGEELLSKKELSQGKPKFQLQFMLDTRMADDGRFPLKIKDLVVADFNVAEGPIMPIWGSGPSLCWNEAPRFGNRTADNFYRCIPKEYKWKAFERVLMYIDPAGGGKNGDETAYAIIGMIGTYIYLLSSGGFPGGYSTESLMQLVMEAKRCNCKEVWVENNYGNGAHAAALRPLFQDHWPVTLEVDNVSHQKELRMADTLGPIIDRHQFIISPDVVRRDVEQCELYALEQRPRYSLFFQMGHLTRDRNCLAHDDRLDALCGAVAMVAEELDYSMDTLMAQQEAAKQIAFIKAWNDPQQRREWVTGTCANRPNAVGTRNRFHRR